MDKTSAKETQLLLSLLFLVKISQYHCVNLVASLDFTLDFRDPARNQALRPTESAPNLKSIRTSVVNPCTFARNVFGASSIDVEVQCRTTEELLVVKWLTLYLILLCPVVHDALTVLSEPALFALGGIQRIIRFMQTFLTVEPLARLFSISDEIQST